MRIIEPSFNLSNPYREELTWIDGVLMLRFIEKQARISHRSEDRITHDSWQKFVKAVIVDRGDWSVAEHCSVTVTIRTDRGITHELVRHRLFSFTQESTRFVRYKDDLEFICPHRFEQTPSFYEEWKGSVRSSEKSYQMLLELDARPQEARSVLPNSLAATIAVTGNLRNWRHFFLMRTSKETHPDFKRITIPMLAEFKKVIPLLYDDIIPDQRQVENLGKPR